MIYELYPNKAVIKKCAHAHAHSVHKDTYSLTAGHNNAHTHEHKDAYYNTLCSNKKQNPKNLGKRGPFQGQEDCEINCGTSIP